MVGSIQGNSSIITSHNIVPKIQFIGFNFYEEIVNINRFRVNVAGRGDGAHPGRGVEPL